MKKILILLSSVFLLSSCDTEMDLTPSDKVAEELAFANIDNAQAVLTGAYDWFHGGWHAHYTDQYMFYLPDLMADDAFVSETANYGRFLATYQYSVVPSSAYTRDPWANFYSLINNANLIIKNIESLPHSEERDRIQGEALALRAFSYHYLARFYSKTYTFAPESPSVILRLEPDAEPLPRATVKEVYAQMEADLLKSIPLLKNSSAKAYIDKRAAQAILARVYLDMGASKREDAIKYATAAVEGITLMDTSTYATEKFSDYNSETIWAYEAGAEDNTYFLSIPSFYYFADGGYYETDKDGKKVLKYKNIVDGYSSFRVSKNLVDLFDDKDVRKKNFPLIDGTNEYLHREGALLSTKIRSRGNNMGQGAINFIRGSEMYLIIAEAAADKGDFTEARKALDKVRTARGLANYTGADATLVDEIQTERRRELFFEGHRVFDIKRRGSKLTRSNPDGTLLQGHWAKMDIEPNGDKFELPISQDEIDANKALTEADQNPFYK